MKIRGVHSWCLLVLVLAWVGACQGGMQHPEPLPANGAGSGPASVARAGSSGSVEASATPRAYESLDPSQTVIAWVAESAGPEGEQWRALVEPDGNGLAVHTPSVGAEVYAFQIPVAQQRELLKWVLEEPSPTPYSTRYSGVHSTVFASQRKTFYSVPDGSYRDQLLQRLRDTIAPWLKADRRISLEVFEQRLTQLRARYAKTKLTDVRFGASWLQEAQALAFESQTKGPLPHERDTGPIAEIVDGRTGLFAYCWVAKWATCGIALDDARVFVLSGAPAAGGAKSGRLAVAERQKLADSVNSERFFDFPVKLHNPNIMDGAQSNLFVASKVRGHATQSYSYPSPSYARVAATLSDSLGRAAQTNLRVDAALASVRVYAKEHLGDERGVMATAWLTDVEHWGLVR